MDTKIIVEFKYSERYKLDLADETIRIQNFHFSRKL